MASTYLSRTPTTTNQKTATLSFWIKKAKTVAENDELFCFGLYPSLNTRLYFRDGADLNKLALDNYGGSTLGFVTNQLFRDYSAWYHIVVAFDTTQTTDTNRLKLYVNGEQVTSFASINYGSLNDNLAFNNSSSVNYIGKNHQPKYFDGSMADVYFIDGLAYDASTFGSFDSTTGIWKPNTAPTVTYGTNGFNLKFTNGADAGEDFSGNNNDLATNGTPTQTLDCPSNVFATFNPVDRSGGTVTTYSNGNLTVKHNAGNNGAVCAQRSTLAISKGKWYWEAKCISAGGDVRIGIISMSSSNYATSSNPFTPNECYNYKQTGEKGSSGPTDVAYGATYTANDIIGVAYNADTGSLTFYKNGTSQGVAFSGLDTSLTWGAFSTEYNQGEYAYNFGNGFFGTTAVVSAGTNAGVGTFEYDVPAGYYALCTKNINTQEYS